jgi:hypothetical protein
MKCCWSMGRWASPSPARPTAVQKPDDAAGRGVGMGNPPATPDGFYAALPEPVAVEADGTAVVQGDGLQVSQHRPSGMVNLRPLLRWAGVRPSKLLKSRRFRTATQIAQGVYKDEAARAPMVLCRQRDARLGDGLTSKTVHPTGELFVHPRLFPPASDAVNRKEVRDFLDGVSKDYLERLGSTRVDSSNGWDSEENRMTTPAAPPEAPAALADAEKPVEFPETVAEPEVADRRVVPVAENPPAVPQTGHQPSEIVKDKMSFTNFDDATGEEIVQRIQSEPVIYRGDRCVTFKMVDRMHGRKNGSSQKLYERYVHQFHLGTDVYHLKTWEEISQVQGLKWEGRTPGRRPRPPAPSSWTSPGWMAETSRSGQGDAEGPGRPSSFLKLPMLSARLIYFTDAGFKESPPLKNLQTGLRRVLQPRRRPAGHRLRGRDGAGLDRPGGA